MQLYDSDGKEVENKINTAFVIINIVFIIFLVRLFYLQILQHAKYERLALKNITREVIIPHPRGLILNANDNVIVDNRSEFILRVDQKGAYNPKIRSTLIWLKQNIDTNIPDNLTFIRKQIDENMNRKFILKKNLKMWSVIKIKEHQLSLSGIDIEERLVRHYIYGKEYSHIVGHVGEIGRKMLRRLGGVIYKQGDFVGQTGVEAACEKYLRGQDGKKVIKVNVHGDYLTTVELQKPIPGDNVTLTIDKRLQDVAFNAFKGKKGGVIAIDPNNGKILTYVSSPGFSPNLFSYGITAAEWSNLLNDTENALLDRVAMTKVSPGSTFKIVTGLAGLSSGRWAVDTIVDDTGSIEVGNETFTGWKKGGLGELNFTDAIAQSDDIYFYNVGMIAGIDEIDSIAGAMGLGQKPVIDLTDVSAGLIPSKAWLYNTRRVRWSTGYTLNTAIGQGDIQVSPLQMAIMLMILANEGTYYKPQFIQKIETYDGDTVETFAPQVVRQVNIKKEYYRDIKLGMYDAVNKAHGTAWRARIRGFYVFGKTGTAQVVRQNDADREAKHRQSHRAHAWFVAGAPYNKPKIVIAVFVENGGEGGRAAAPIARRVLYEYYKILKGKGNV